MVAAGHRFLWPAKSSPSWWRRPSFSVACEEFAARSQPTPARWSGTTVPCRNKE